MKKRYTEEQIAFALRQAESGTSVAEIRIRLRDLATSRVRYGYRRLHILLQREGWRVNHKLVYRLYCEEGLVVRRRKPRRHKSSTSRLVPTVAREANEHWSMDFLGDQLFSG